MALRFKGFSQASSVALSVSAGGVTEAASVASWGSVASVAITVTQHQLGVAPHAAIFEIDTLDGFDTPAPTGLYDERLHDFVFLWDFDDASGPAWTAPEQIYPGHNDPNVAYGHSVAHVYTAPGTYSPSVLVIELSSGKTASWTTEITVQDPDTVFPGANTIYVWKGSNANAPAGADTSHSGNDGLNDALIAIWYQSTPKRIMLERGATFTPTTNPWILKNNPNIYICADGTGGAEPVVDLSSCSQFTLEGPSSSNGVGRDMMFSNIRFQGTWDAEACISSNNTTPPVGFLGLQREDRRYGTVLIHNCLFDGLDLAANQIDLIADTLVISNSKVTNFRDYAFLCGGDSFRFVSLGSEFNRGAYAGMGPSGRSSKDFGLNGGDGVGWNMHSPVRIGAAATVISDACDYFSATGWPGLDFPYNTAQPCMRLLTGQTLGTTCRVNLQRNAFEAAGSQSAIAFATVEGKDLTINALVERNMFFMNAMRDDVIAMNHNGITARHNQVVIGDRSDYTGTWGDRFATIGINRTDVRADGKCKAEFNTIIAHGAGRTTLDIFKDTTGGAVPLVANDNLVHRPDAGSTPYAPLDTATSMFTPRYPGYVHPHEYWTGTLAAAVANGETLRVLYADGTRDGTSVQSHFRETGQKLAHRVKLGSDGGAHTDGYTKTEGEISCAFDATGCTITNNSGATWSAGSTYHIHLERYHAHAWIETAFKPSAGLSVLSRPAVGSPALGAASTEDVYDDFSGAVRPLYPSIGALEAAE